jgi:hypothetical protein
MLSFLFFFKTTQRVVCYVQILSIVVVKKLKLEVFFIQNSISQPILTQNTYKNTLGTIINISMVSKNQKKPQKPKLT